MAVKGVQFTVEVPGLAAAMAPTLSKLVGKDRIDKMRKGISKAANRVKYYLRKEMVKHQRSGLLYRNTGYRAKYYRNRDVMVAVIGVRSKHEQIYKGRKQVSHMYAGFLFNGRKAAKQMLKQPPFAPRNPNGKPKWPRTSGPQTAKINLQDIINANIAVIRDAAIRGVML